MENYLEWGYLGLFVASFLAATILPLSSELFLSALLAGGASFEPSLSVATLGNWLGGLSSYGLGRLGKWSALERFFGLQKTKIEGAQNKINRWRSFLAFFLLASCSGRSFCCGLGVL